jgi:NAD(P)-dependent dehydrogenase (short-subunit alcohol dehydrogenase family)
MEKLFNETKCNSNQLRLMECDLSSFDSVRNFVKFYLNEEERLDILICNAGLGYSTDKITQDGFNPVIQSNYLSHFLLTNLLLNKLKESKPSRILNVSSDLHKGLRFFSKFNNYLLI